MMQRAKHYSLLLVSIFLFFGCAHKFPIIESSQIDLTNAQGDYIELLKRYNDLEKRIIVKQNEFATSYNKNSKILARWDTIAGSVIVLGQGYTAFTDQSEKTDELFLKAGALTFFSVSIRKLAGLDDRFQEKRDKYIEYKTKLENLHKEYKKLKPDLEVNKKEALNEFDRYLSAIEINGVQ